MDWNQDPHLQRLEEKLDRVLERLDLIEERIGQPRKFHTIQEVAEILGVKERTVRHHINETKLLPYLKISKKIIIRDEDLSGFIESQLKNKLLKEWLMKNKSEILVGYRPRVSVYPKTHASGRVDFYVSYYLPGVKRKVARPLHCKKSETKRVDVYPWEKIKKSPIWWFWSPKDTRDLSTRIKFTSSSNHGCSREIHDRHFLQ